MVQIDQQYHSRNSDENRAEGAPSGGGVAALHHKSQDSGEYYGDEYDQRCIGIKTGVAGVILKRIDQNSDNGCEPRQCRKEYHTGCHVRFHLLTASRAARRNNLDLSSRVLVIENTNTAQLLVNRFSRPGSQGGPGKVGVQKSEPHQAGKQPFTKATTHN